jgi:adenylylsulfate kinase
VRRAGEISKIVCDAGLVALSSFISPFRQDRESVRKSHEESGITFVEVFVDCSTEEAERRDPKGLYKRARGNEIKNFTGIDHPYEPPESPDIHLKSDVMSLEQEVEKLLEFITLNNILGEESKLQS